MASPVQSDSDFCCEPINMARNLHAILIKLSCCIYEYGNLFAKYGWSYRVNKYMTSHSMVIRIVMNGNACHRRVKLPTTLPQSQPNYILLVTLFLKLAFSAMLFILHLICTASIVRQLKNPNNIAKLANSINNGAREM